MTAPYDDTPVPATVVRLDAKGCLVRVDEPMKGLAGAAEGDAPGFGHELWCGIRGRIHLRDRRRQKSPVVVGDRVLVIRSAEDRGAVESIETRRSTLSRPAPGGRKEHVLAANVDQVVIMSSAAEPDFNAGLVDRVLAVVEYSELDAVIVLNKIDLIDEAASGPLLQELEAYQAMGYPVLLTSATQEAGIDAVRDVLAGRTSVVTGHSGVGKSSVLNAVQPALGLAVGDVNAVTRRGTHTTTAAVWIPLATGGAVIDTAGIREFGLFGIPARDVGWLFRDIAEVAPGCKYPDCSHTHEPGCAVHDAVEAGGISKSRFASYLRILESVGDQGASW